MVKLRKSSGVIVAVIALLAAGAMAARFAAAERSFAPLLNLPPAQTVAGAGHPAAEGQININTATAEELQRLPGIGEVKAEAIVAWRSEYGAFRYPEELIRVPGIGEGILAKILDQISTGGE